MSRDNRYLIVLIIVALAAWFTAAAVSVYLTSEKHHQQISDTVS